MGSPRSRLGWLRRQEAPPGPGAGKWRRPAAEHGPRAGPARSRPARPPCSCPRRHVGERAPGLRAGALAGAGAGARPGSERVPVARPERRAGAGRAGVCTGWRCSSEPLAGAGREVVAVSRARGTGSTRNRGRGRWSSGGKTCSWVRPWAVVQGPRAAGTRRGAGPSSGCQDGGSSRRGEAGAVRHGGSLAIRWGQPPSESRRGIAKDRCAPRILHSVLGEQSLPKKREGLDKEEEKEGLRFGCRSWPAKGVQRVELVGQKREPPSINLGSSCVSLKGGTGLFVGGDPTCLPRKGTAHCFKSGVTWGGHRKGMIGARKNSD